MEVTWIGPAQPEVEKQIELIARIIPTQPDVIAVAANDRAAIVPILAEAQAAGIHVMSWDADSDLRELFVNLVDYEAFGVGLADTLAEQIGAAGDVAVVTTTFAATNQMRWMESMTRRLYARYPDIKILDIRPVGESREASYRIAQDYLTFFPTLKGIVALGAPNLPGVASAVRDAGKGGEVAVVGNSTPNLMREFLKDETVERVLLWDAKDHGYLTLYGARELLLGRLAPGRPFKAGRLGLVTPEADGVSAQVSLPILVFTRENVDRFDF